MKLSKKKKMGKNNHKNGTRGKIGIAFGFLAVCLLTAFTAVANGDSSKGSTASTNLKTPAVLAPTHFPSREPNQPTSTPDPIQSGGGIPDYVFKILGDKISSGVIKSSMITQAGLDYCVTSETDPYEFWCVSPDYNVYLKSVYVAAESQVPNVVLDRFEVRFASTTWFLKKHGVFEVDFGYCIQHDHNWYCLEKEGEVFTVYDWVRSDSGKKEIFNRRLLDESTLVE